MQKGIKFRTYPTDKQKEILEQTFGCCRFIYNFALDSRIKAYESGKPISYEQTCAKLTEMKHSDDYSFLKKADAVALQQSLRDLDCAYKNFFSKRGKYPKFKSKHNHIQRYRTFNQDNHIRIEGSYIKLPKLGYMKIKQTIPVSNIKYVVVEKTPTNKYFVVLNVEFEPEIRTNNGGVIGIDVGVDSFYTDNNGNHLQNPRYLEKSEHKLKREQRKLSRKKQGSNNYSKQRTKVAQIYEKITNQKNDFLQKQSTILIRENQTICIETLDINSMIRNHGPVKSIWSASWSKFFLMLEYKSEWYGNTLVKVPHDFASSRICSCCGYKNNQLKNYHIRQWECPRCHRHHDRDTNASINILNYGMTLI